MKRLLRRSLLAVAVAAVAVGSTATAQINVIDDISQAPVFDRDTFPLGEVNAIIDSNGQLTIQIGFGLQVWGIETLNNDNFFNTDAASPGLRDIDPAVPGFLLSPGTQNDPDAIGIVQTGFLSSGAFNLGNIFPAGLTVEDLTAAGFNLRFDGAGRDPSNNFNETALELSLIHI